MESQCEARRGGYLEGGGQVVLEEPELDRGVGMPQDRQHHYSGIERWTGR